MNEPHRTILEALLRAKFPKGLALTEGQTVRISWNISEGTDKRAHTKHHKVDGTFE